MQLYASDWLVLYDSSAELLAMAAINEACRATHPTPAFSTAAALHTTVSNTHAHSFARQAPPTSGQKVNGMSAYV
jgi:hypothetical protein